MLPDIKKPLKAFVRHLAEARDANLNEADTVQRIERLFETVLGYDLLQDVSREAQMKGKFVDVVIKVDGTVRLLLEAKSASTVLRDRHIEQAQSYAARNNYRWTLLTNGIQWRLYHLTFDEGIDYELAFSVDLCEGFDEAAEKLALLHKQAMRKDELDQFWRVAVALSPASIAKALFHEQTLRIIRRLVRKEEGFLVDVEDLAKSIHEMLTAEAREVIGPARVRRAKARPPRRPRAQVVTPAPTAATSSTLDGVLQPPIVQQTGIAGPGLIDRVEGVQPRVVEEQAGA